MPYGIATLVTVSVPIVDGRVPVAAGKVLNAVLPV